MVGFWFPAARLIAAFSAGVTGMKITAVRRSLDGLAAYRLPFLAGIMSIFNHRPRPSIKRAGFRFHFAPAIILICHIDFRFVLVVSVDLQPRQ